MPYYFFISSKHHFYDACVVLRFMGQSQITDRFILYIYVYKYIYLRIHFICLPNMTVNASLELDQMDQRLKWHLSESRFGCSQNFQIQKTRTVDFAKPGRIHPDQLINQPSVWLPSEIVGPAIFVLADSPRMTWSSHLKRHFQLQIMAKDLSSLCSTRMHMCVALKSLKQSAWTAAKG